MNMENNRRRVPTEEQSPRPVLAGVPVREDDIPANMGLHWVAWLFRAMAVLLFVLMVLQVALGLASAVEISYGVLFAEAVRLLIFSALLWGFAALADLFVRSHHDLRATRVLLARIAYRLREPEQPAPPAEADPDLVPGHDDARYRH
jgi:hypothetical protein